MDGTWAPTVILDKEKLQYEVKVDQSAIIYDAKTEEIIGVIIRNACGDPGVLQWVTGIIRQNVGWRRNVRVRVPYSQTVPGIDHLWLQKADPGHICQIGYTTGARSKPKLDWARNLVRKISQEDLFDLNYQSSSAFALFWNMVQSRLPPEVTRSFDTFLEETGIPRMDVYKKVGASKGNYMVSDMRDTYVFHDVPLPPPSGVCVQNYARYV